MPTINDPWKLRVRIVKDIAEGIHRSDADRAILQMDVALDNLAATFPLNSPQENAPVLEGAQKEANTATAFMTQKNYSLYYNEALRLANLGSAASMELYTRLLDNLTHTINNPSLDNACHLTRAAVAVDADQVTNHRSKRRMLGGVLIVAGVVMVTLTIGIAVGPAVAAAMAGHTLLSVGNAALAKGAATYVAGHLGPYLASTPAAVALSVVAGAAAAKIGQYIWAAPKPAHVKEAENVAHTTKKKLE